MIAIAIVWAFLMGFGTGAGVIYFTALKKMNKFIKYKRDLEEENLLLEKPEGYEPWWTPTDRKGYFN